MSKYYTDYADYLHRFFDGKMQKLTVNAGFTCPNRDGTKSLGGCKYCNVSSFTPPVKGETVIEQLEAGKQFFAHKYPAMRYLAYFQSYTNTYAHIDDLLNMYSEALGVEGVEGLIIGTRPDMMPDNLLRELSILARDHYVMIEYGAESSHDATLEAINRCHTWYDVVDAVNRTHEAGLHTGLHLIMGLPGETTAMMLETVEKCCKLPVDVLKFHQLQILRGTAFEKEADAITTFSIEDYLDLCTEIVTMVPRHIAIERFTSSAPARLLVKPRWGIKNYEFVHLLNNRLSHTHQS